MTIEIPHIDCFCDICEERLPREVLAILLLDQTTSENIYWACKDYESLGDKFAFFSPIEINSITGEYDQVVMPRVLKHERLQRHRSKKMAEVFTPTWICNDMINQSEETFFGILEVFNTPFYKDGQKDWIPSEKIAFPSDKSWKDYLRRTCMEITCGEAPFLVSRYDATTGIPIPIEKRIGILDRRLRVVGENTNEFKDWYEWALIAFQGVYGYEWQGDNLLLARENLLVTFSDYYYHKWNNMPSVEELKEIATIISWNIFQMDGLKYVLPNSCKNNVVKEVETFFGLESHIENCQACKGEKVRHNGIYAKIKDWDTNQVFDYVSLTQ